MKENKIILNDFQIRYLKSEKYSSSKKKNVLFIHGLGSSSDRWGDIPDALSRYFYPIVAVDLIGFGGSDKPVTPEYTIEYFSKFIREVISCKQIWINHDNDDDNHKTIIIGHSLGGYIATKVAIDDHDLIEKLVLIDSSGMLTKPTPILEQYLYAALNPSLENVKSVFEQMLGNPTLLNPTLVDAFIKRINLKGAKHAFKSAFENSTKNHIESSELQSIENIPALIIWGAADKVIPVTHSKRFNEAFKNSKLQIIEDAGHAPFSEKPSMVFDIIREFLTNNK
ncbi:MAG TPA: alpha/beta hydrolase [Candidatus Nitrosocosmicus sp.]|nr:alpha/beta hydrolase [Candidatus Nitrosocosmicus sp.]